MRHGKQFKSFKKHAAHLAASSAGVLSLLKSASLKANSNQNHFLSIWDDLATLFRLLKAWALRRYQGLEWKTIILALAAVLYFVNPLDAIPDFLPGGFIDDLAILAAVLKQMRSELSTFVEWEKLNP